MTEPSLVSQLNMSLIGNSETMLSYKSGLQLNAISFLLSSLLNSRSGLDHHL